MKLRIQDNSFRFRITLRELEILRECRRLRVESRFGPGLAQFAYEIAVADEGGESRLDTGSGWMRLVLSVQDLEELAGSDQEGIYIRREWQDEHGSCRSLAFVEKDRPATSCSKPEQWIYDHRPVAGSGSL